MEFLSNIVLSNKADENENFANDLLIAPLPLKGGKLDLTKLSTGDILSLENDSLYYHRHPYGRCGAENVVFYGFNEDRKPLFFGFKGIFEDGKPHTLNEIQIAMLEDFLKEPNEFENNYHAYYPLSSDVSDRIEKQITVIKEIGNNNLASEIYQPEIGITLATENIERIKIRINRMEHLVDDLLIYARAGKRAGESTQVNVPELICGIIEMHPIPESFSIIQRIDIDLIQAARTPLETVLRNLFNNALKHHDGINPRIEICAEAEGSYCLFSVIDNGPGIPDAAHERVFRLFQTLTANERAGSGIGLALAKRLTESHGGRIELAKQQGARGAFFRVWWPRFPRRDIDE